MSSTTSPTPSAATAHTTSQPLPQPRSWSEALQQYQQLKHTDPTLQHAPPHRYLPTTHPLHTDAIHTITGQYKRQGREENVRAAEVAAEERRVERLQHIPTRAYNIVNNQPTPTANPRHNQPPAPAQPTSASPNPSRREYDIVNNHLYYPDSEQRLQATDSLQLQRLHNHAAVKLQRERREYNNITHQYYVRNEEKQQVDEAGNAAVLRGKYFESRHYDPVVGQYCDPRKEVEWRRQKAEEEQKWAGRRGGGQTDMSQLLSGNPQ